MIPMLPFVSRERERERPRVGSQEWDKVSVRQRNSETETETRGRKRFLFPLFSFTHTPVCPSLWAPDSRSRVKGARGEAQHSVTSESDPHASSSHTCCLDRHFLSPSLSLRIPCHCTRVPRHTHNPSFAAVCDKASERERARDSHPAKRDVLSPFQISIPSSKRFP